MCEDLLWADALEGVLIEDLQKQVHELTVVRQPVALVLADLLGQTLQQLLLLLQNLCIDAALYAEDSHADLALALARHSTALE